MSFVIRPSQLAVATYLKEHGPSIGTGASFNQVAYWWSA